MSYAFFSSAHALSAVSGGLSWKAKSAAGAALVAALGCAGAWAAASVDDLTGPWQLFVDDYPIASKTNVVRTYHPFQKYANNPVLVADQPWEQPMVYLYGTVLPNETHTGYRMWYHCLRTNNSICPSWSNELYATSTNGINWVKSPLNLRSTCGSASNNMYYTRPTGGGITSVMQTPSDPDPGQLYKFMNYDSGGFYGAWSPDGIHLTDAPNNPVFVGGSDVGQFSWDPHTQLYRGYVKNAWYDWNGLKRRAVALTTTTNITSWPQESLILWPDAYDDRWAIPGSVQRTHFYGLSAFAYESMYIGFLWIFRATDTTGDMPGYLVGPCFVELVSSHDGIHWTREEEPRPPLIALGAAGSWDDGMIFTARAPIVEGDTIKVWYGGFDQVHGSSLPKTKGAIGLATLRKDGFASLDAGAALGTILTQPLTNAGGLLQLNYRAVGGSIKVEVLDQNGNVLPGYAQTDCVPLTGDSVTQAVTWAAHSELPTGTPPLRLRFILQNASLYSFMAGASVAVMQPPTITQQPTSQTIAPGASAAFGVGASGTGPLSYQWQKDQLNLSEGGHYSGCTAATLTITDADSSDSAVYRCVVTNACGSATSSPATLTVGQNAFGSVTLTNIPLLSGDTSNDARAITPDGRLVAGISGSRGFLYGVNTANIVNVVSSDGAQSTNLTGVGYRTNGSRQEVVLSGLAGGWFTAWMTTNGGATYGAKIQVTSGKKPTVPLANGLAGAAADVFYSTWTDEGTGGTDNWGSRVGQGSGPWPASPVWGQKDVPKPDTCQMNGVSSRGRAVGWRRNGTTLAYANYVADWQGSTTPAMWNFTGLDGTTAGQAYSVSADGTVIFGMSPKGSATGSTNYGYKAVFTAAFPGAAAQMSLSQLPNFPDTTGSLSLAIPYGCSSDGKYAVGMNYRGVEKAVLWDTDDSNPAKWTVVDLTDVAAANGILGSFARLSRAYSAGVNAAGALVIVGVGVDTNTPGNTRAFLMTLAPPLAPIAFPPTVTTTALYPTGVKCSFLSLANPSIMCYLEYTTSLVSPMTWTMIASTPSTGGLTSLSDPNPSDQHRFYRIRFQ
jgi:hypothetical protein